MNRLIITFTVLAGFGLSTLQAQVITPVESRENLLKGMATTLGNVNEAPGDYTAVLSPFVPREKKIEIVQTKDLTNAPSGLTGSQKLPDEVALRMIGDRFNPIGSMVLGNRGVLQMANNTTIEMGSSFKAEIKGNIYEVQVNDVTSQGYTLTLGTATIRKNFLTTTGATH